MHRTIRESDAPSYKFWLLTAFFVLVFTTGGASRADAQSLAILRPSAVFLCAIACITLQKRHIIYYKWPLGAFFGVFCLAGIHLIPLPPALWQSLPGREKLVSVEHLADLENIWRPLTMTPMNGWNALASLSVPLAVLLIGIQLERRHLYGLLPVLIVLAVISGFLGLLQIIGDPKGPLYFYQITNNGSAVGLFSNRNHAATLLACIFPMLAVFASTLSGSADRRRGRLVISAAIAVIVIPLILVTGSRSGFLTGIIGLAGGTFLYLQLRPNRPNKAGFAWLFNLKSLLICSFAVGIGIFTYMSSRAQSIERMLSSDVNEDNRAQFWKVTADLFWEYFPWGSGSGSFVEVFKMSEPVDLLSSTYVNHAHNDWLEIALSFGLPGLLILTFLVTAYFYNIVLIWRRKKGSIQSRLYGWMSGICIAMIALASVGDYPLRTPIFMSIFVIYILWFSAAISNDIHNSNFQSLDNKT